MDHFWPFYSASPQKNSKKMYEKWTFEKNPFLLKNEKLQIFFLRRAINSTKMVKNSKFFCSITSYAPNDTVKYFVIIGAIFEKWTPDSWKKPVSPKIQVRLESLPIAKTSSLNDFLRFGKDLGLWEAKFDATRDLWTTPVEACWSVKNFLMHQKHQNKLVHTCLSPWQHVEANESIRRCFKRFLIAKMSPLADFCGFKHSKALQKSNFINNCSKITILKFTLFVCVRAKTFLGQKEHQNKLLRTCVGP